MERLTYRRAKDYAVCVSGMTKENAPEKVQEIAERLAAYEDIGLTPEGMHELLHQSYGPLHKKLGGWISAEQDGRLLILSEARKRAIVKDDNHCVSDFTAEEINNLLEAWDAGRIVVLPVKADDLMELLQKAAVHAVYEAVLNTGCISGSKEIFIAAKEGIEQRFKNFDTIRMKAESELTGRDV